MLVDNNNAAYPYSVIIQPDNKIVVASSYLRSMISRFNENGLPDLSFNNSGYSLASFTPFTSSNDLFHSVFMLPNGALTTIGVKEYDRGNGRVNHYTTVNKYHSGLNLSNDSFEKNNVKLFPNPTNNKVYFDNSQTQFTNVSICNYLGQEVGSQKINFTNNQEINLDNFANGIYILKLFNQNETVSAKVVKQD